MNNIFEIEYIRKFPFVKIGRRSLFQIIIISFCAGVIGFILETLLIYIFSGVLVDRGFLCGPFIPIYALVIFFSLLYIKVNKPSLSYFIKLFFIFGFGISAIEFVVGNLCELLLNVELWNYNDVFPLSYKYVSFTVATIWGLLCSFSFVYVIPFFKRKLEIMPHRIYPSLIIISSSLFLLDLIITILIIVKNGKYYSLYKIDSSLQLTFFMIGIVFYIYASIILGKFIYHYIFKIKKVFIIVYIVSLFIPVFSVIDYINRFALPLFSFLARLGFIVLAVYIYFLMFLFLILIIANIFRCFFTNNKRHYRIYLSSSLILSIVITFFGFYSAHNPSFSYLKIGEGNNNYRIVCVSDVHYKTTGYRPDLEKMVNMINSADADIVFLLGDIIDAKSDDINKNYFFTNLDRIKSKYGIFAIVGNHELNYNSLSEIKSLYNQTKIKLLLDEVVCINNEIAVVGRIDDSSKQRKSLSDLIEGVNLPIMVLDHQPITFNESIKCGINYQLSGHTHNGQMFPMNYIVKMYNSFLGDIPLSSGLYKKDNKYLFISKGYGCWGFPLRTSGRGEIAIIDLFLDE